MQGSKIVKNISFKKIIKLAFIIIFIMIVCSLVTIFIANKVVEKETSKKVYNSTKDIPHNKVGVVLGTAKYLANGYQNLYYIYRINAAVKLFEASKIDFLIVSGDNSTKNYNEPLAMKNDLVAKGIPEDKIYLDYAGFRTLDSVVRSKEIFGQKSITIISQKFHNQRAIYIAKQKNIKAVGFNAQDVNIYYYKYRVILREHLARVKMLIDLVIGKEPKFLGSKIDIK